MVLHAGGIREPRSIAKEMEVAGQILATVRADQKLDKGRREGFINLLLGHAGRLRSKAAFQAGQRLGRTFDFLRRGHGFTTQQVARSLGISEQDYLKFERGTLNPNDATCEKLATLFPELGNAQAVKFMRDSQAGVPMMSERGKITASSSLPALRLEGVDHEM